ncbi:geranylgeranyl reductase family protein [Acidithiobacillus sulfuriphilus]|uniref:NAD(P)/FAD-dependent oxidoreductase n=2 Tax=Acidithiobacillus sulfuriphilus TaxID=1867749 RepID=A0A3M8RJ49_9PROT|nr:NAD(P)/FAD-dependent oxidoreductase [Acidithiobacillus sulfuriphilus]RNF68345.1 NAD(P)/FAD-dependent oxidoreductase [Acidithiobacillus sulfuriphilus]
MTVRDVDVLVVGSGPGGAAAAREAARRGLGVLLVERREAIGVPVQCAEFVPMPLLRTVRETASRVQEVEGMLTVLPSGAGHHSVFPGIMIDRARFDQGLAELAVAAGAALWTRCHFMTWDGETAVLRRGDEERIAVRPRLLIGADGPHSMVADAIGLDHQAVVYTRQYTVPLLRPYPDTDIFLSDEFPGGYGWLFPKEPVANIGLGADRRFADNLKTPLDHLHRQMVARGLVAPEILGRTGGAIPVGGMRPMVHGPVILVGDAAGLTHPITGAGIPAAVISGERAGQAAAAWLGGDGDALESFAEDMRDQFGPAIGRAVARRKALEAVWRQPAAQDDRVMRSGWIAFEEYFAA